jgi:hypothetical protein
MVARPMSDDHQWALIKISGDDTVDALKVLGGQRNKSVIMQTVLTMEMLDTS